MTRILLLLLASAASARAPDDDLTRELARSRKEQVESVEYDLRFRLDKASGAFSGSAAIDLTLARTDLPLSVDFLGRGLKVRVNGEPVEVEVRRGSFDIPASALARKTRVEAEFTGDYSADGRGPQRSLDPEDGSEYVTTDFEPYQAHRLFPCFDQPDLKAVFRLTVDAPSDWTALGNALPESESSSGTRKTTVFQPTQPISPYLFFVGAGPWAEWKDEHHGLPLTLHSRRTLAKFVDAPRIFSTVKKGLTFFEEYFGSPYPFPKYGQVFGPEFDWGGMENPGAVVVNERYIFRGPVPPERMDDRDSLILHEMAHMWFGDLVTMSWWDDLWLNESFATYAAALAMDRAVKSPGAWISFFSQKTWGYWQDQLSTTHPIETDVPDVRTVKGNFDGITYSKGAASLKQLHYFAGEDGFREGLRAYFKAFAFDNTTRADFVNAIAGAAKKDLEGWTKAWLQTAGPHRVRADWACADGRLSSFSILQSTNASGVLSPHKTRVGLFSAGPALAKAVDVEYFAAETPVPALRGEPCPAFVHLNLGDQDYALAALDPVSLKSAGAALRGGLRDPLARLQTWHSLGQMMRDGLLAPGEYFEAALPALAAEHDEHVLGVLLGRHSPFLKQWKALLAPASRAALAPRLEELLWSRMERESGKTKLLFFDFHASVAHSSKAAGRLESALAGSPPKGVTMDQDWRWALVGRLAALGRPGAEALVAAEERRDPSINGKRRAYAARAAMPSPAAKDAAWAGILGKELPFSTRRLASESFNDWDRPELAAAFADRWFAKAAELDWSAHDSLVETFFEDLFPKSVCSRELLDRGRAELERAPKLSALARRAWREAVDELEACVRARSAAPSKAL